MGGGRYLAVATVALTFTTTQPGAPAGLTYRSELHGADGGDPPPLRRLIVGVPRGAVVDTSVLERCTASDEELRLRGDGVCPEGSFLGTGWAEILVSGLGRQRFDQRAFNVDGGQLQTVKQGDQVNAIVRGRLTDEGLDMLIPTCVTGGQPPSGCPDDQATLLASELVLPEHGRYFTTPPACPAAGRWESTIVLTYADGVTERLATEQPCVAEAARAPCRSRRRIVFAALARVGLRSITATLRGRRLRLDPRRPVLDLRGQLEGRYTVRLEAVTKSGRRLRFTRRYRTCTA